MGVQGKGTSVPRNACVTAGIPHTYPQDCGCEYPSDQPHNLRADDRGGPDPAIIGRTSGGPNGGSGATVSLNATATITGSTIVLSAPVPPNSGSFTPQATSYGRASWPMTIFFSSVAEGSLPVIPWYSNLSSTNAWSPPTWAADDEAMLAHVAGIGVQAN